MYIVWSGYYYSDGVVDSVYHNKAEAERDIKNKGFRQEGSSGLFVNGTEWYRVNHLRCVDRLT